MDQTVFWAATTVTTLGDLSAADPAEVFSPEEEEEVYYIHKAPPKSKDGVVLNGESPERQKLKGLSDGVLFVTTTNASNREVVPSHNNYFGKLKISVVVVDSGCTSLLLPIEDKWALDTIFSCYSKTKYEYRVGTSSGVSGHVTLTLIVRSTPFNKFSVVLCKDLIENPIPVAINKLMFTLCYEDVDEICKKRIDSFATSYDDVLLMEKWLKNTVTAQGGKGTLPRRKHALLGQSFCKDLCAIKCRDVTHYVDPKVHQLGGKTWVDMGTNFTT